jgi:hypothetical protein
MTVPPATAAQGAIDTRSAVPALEESCLEIVEY